MRISTVEELLDLLDNLTPERSDATSRAAAQDWMRVLTRPEHPLNSALPDVNLPAWHSQGLLPDGAGRRALDVGCGLGRNAGWLARHGWAVTGIDIAAAAIDEAIARHAETGARFVECDFLRDLPPTPRFDLVYDSGCFHHLAPHRRISYRAVLDRALMPGGFFAICTFTAGEMGSSATDAELLIRGRFGDGIGYTLPELVDIFSEFELLDGGPQGQYTGDPQALTQPFLTAVLFRKAR